MKVIIAFLPFLLDIFLKLYALKADPRVMMRAFNDLLNLPKPTGETFDITRDQRELIIEACSNASLRSVAVLTAFISSCNATAILYEAQSTVSLVMLGVIFISSGGLLLWLLSSDVLDMSEVVPSLRAKKASLVIWSLILYDIVLGCVSIYALNHPGSKPTLPCS